MANQGYFWGGCPPGQRPVGVRPGPGGSLVTICGPTSQPASAGGQVTKGNGGGGVVLLPSAGPCGGGSTAVGPAGGFTGSAIGSRKRPDPGPVFFINSQTLPKGFKVDWRAFGLNIPEAR